MQNFLQILFYLEGMDVTQMALRIKKRGGWNTFTASASILPYFDKWWTRWTRIELEHCMGMDGHIDLKFFVCGALFGRKTLEGSQEEYVNIPVKIFNTGLMASIKEVTVQTKM